MQASRRAARDRARSRTSGGARTRAQQAAATPPPAPGTRGCAPVEPRAAAPQPPTAPCRTMHAERAGTVLVYALFGARMFSLVLLVATAPQDYRLCGKYCGPVRSTRGHLPVLLTAFACSARAQGWCGGEMVSEHQCRFDAAADSCADECCKVHDGCCAGADRTSCNKAMNACLRACPARSLGDEGQCMLDEYPSANAIYANAPPPPGRPPASAAPAPIPP